MAVAEGRFDYVGNLKFKINDSPKWRKNGISTSEMLSDIVRFHERWLHLSESAQEFVTNSFAMVMTTKFVLNVNVSSSIGTQTADGTQAVLEEYLDNKVGDSSKPSSKQEIENCKRETINVYKALVKFFKLRTEMENTGKLTVQRICDVHRELMSGLHDNAGSLREAPAFVLWNDQDHIYPDHLLVEPLFYACIDHHCVHMSSYAKEFVKDNHPIASEESFGYLFRCAARLMFDFVDVHPFSDGNGRMCRLLANYVLTMITPFPVAPYSGKEGRDNYINAIVECRDKRDRGPGTLAAMLIEGTWRGWTSLFYNLGENSLLSPKRSFGPIVVSKSESDESKREKISKSLQRFKIEPRPDLLDCVIQAIDHETSLSDDNAVLKVISLSPDADLRLQIYK